MACLSNSAIAIVYIVSAKKEKFIVISSIKLGRFCWNLVHSFLNKFAAKSLLVLHLIWIMFYTILWDLKCSLRLAATELLEKETPEFIPTQLCFQIRQIWTQLITACVKFCEIKCTKHVSLIWTKWMSDWERSSQAESHHCGSHLSVASSPQRASDGPVWTFWAPSLTFVTALNLLVSVIYLLEMLTTSTVTCYV